MAKAKRSLWSQLCDAMQEDNRARAAEIVAKMEGDERAAGERWLHGPTAAQRRESAARQRTINATTVNEIARHCQTGDLF